MTWKLVQSEESFFGLRFWAGGLGITAWVRGLRVVSGFGAGGLSYHDGEVDGRETGK